MGTSGWQYDSWVGPFYQKADATLGEYASVFATVEVNNSFYGLPERETLAAWRDELERGGDPERRAVSREFTFSFKASRYLTHMKKLKDPDEPLERFLGAIEPLRDLTDVVLFQLPPRWRRNDERLRRLLERLPTTYRYAFEFRDESWYHEETYAALREHNAAFCIYHLAGHLSPREVTADYVYIRLHGAGDKYEGSYSNEELAGWVGAISSWVREGRDVYLYFDNDQAAAAPHDARRVLKMLA